MATVTNSNGGIKVSLTVDVLVIEAFLTGASWRWTEQGGPQMKDPRDGLWYALEPQVIDGVLTIGISETGVA